MIQMCYSGLYRKSGDLILCCIITEDGTGEIIGQGTRRELAGCLSGHELIGIPPSLIPANIDRWLRERGTSGDF